VAAKFVATAILTSSAATCAADNARARARHTAPTRFEIIVEFCLPAFTPKRSGTWRNSSQEYPRRSIRTTTAHVRWASQPRARTERLLRVARILRRRLTRWLRALLLPRGPILRAWLLRLFFGFDLFGLGDGGLLRSREQRVDDVDAEVTGDEIGLDDRRVADREAIAFDVDAHGIAVDRQRLADVARHRAVEIVRDDMRAKHPDQRLAVLGREQLVARHAGRVEGLVGGREDRVRRFAGQRVVEADGFQRVDEYREVVAFRRDLVEAFRSPGSGGLVVERRGRTRFGLRRLVQRLVGGRGLAGLGDA